MPEGGYQRSRIQRFLGTVFVRDADAERWAEQADKPISGPDNETQHYALANRPTARTRCRFVDTRFRSCSGGHTPL